MFISTEARNTRVGLSSFPVRRQCPSRTKATALSALTTPVAGPNLVPAPADMHPVRWRNCSGNIKDIFEGTGGLWYSFFAGPYGTLKLGLQYSYVKVNTWTGLGSTGVCGSKTNPSCTPNANENMVFTSLRYYIP